MTQYFAGRGDLPQQWGSLTRAEFGDPLAAVWGQKLQGRLGGLCLPKRSEEPRNEASSGSPKPRTLEAPSPHETPSLLGLFFSGKVTSKGAVLPRARDRPAPLLAPPRASVLCRQHPESLPSLPTPRQPASCAVQTADVGILPPRASRPRPPASFPFLLFLSNKQKPEHLAASGARVQMPSRSSLLVSCPFSPFNFVLGPSCQLTM